MVFIKAGIEWRIHHDRASNDRICEEGSTSATLDSGPEITIITLWRPNTVFARAVSDTTQGAHKDYKGQSQSVRSDLWKLSQSWTSL